MDCEIACQFLETITYIGGVVCFLVGLVTGHFLK